MGIIEDEEDVDNYQTKALKVSHESSTPRSVLNSTTLPTEIMIEILLKLPVESLLRCKSVCKLWFSLISDSHFVKTHLSLSVHNNSKRLLFCLDFYGSVICLNDELMAGNFINNALEVVDYPLKSTCNSVKVVGSCNGLLCLDIFSMNANILFIWNPSTRKYHKLPSGAYRTNVFPVHFGFGYDDSTDDYKVVSVFRRYNDLKTFVQMYSLRNGSWKDIGAFPQGSPFCHGKFVNGALHWEASFYTHWKIISLDLATENFGEVLQPVYDEGRKHRILGYLGEWLCVLCHYNKVRLDLWVLKVYGVKDSWTKLVSLPYMTDRLMLDDSLMPLCISNDGRILLTFEKNLIYNLKNNSFSDVKYFDYRVLASTFVESLVSPMPPAEALGHSAKRWTKVMVEPLGRIDASVVRVVQAKF